MAFHPSRSLRTAAAACILVAIALLVFAAGALAAGKTCKGRTEPWKVNGKTVCLKTAKPARGHAAAETQARVKRWFAGGKLPLGRKAFKVPAKLLAARPKAAKIGAQLLTLRPRLRARLGSAKASSSGPDTRGPVVETMSEDGPSVTLDNGVVLTSHVEGTAYADGSQSIDGYVAMKLGQYQVQYRPIADLSTTLVPEVECPTADGRLTIDYKNTVGGTVTALRGRTVLGALTLKTTEILHARGQVGRDAHLQSVKSSVSEKTEIYSRGVQQVIVASGDYTISRDGDPVRQGPITADVSIRVASASRSQERAAEKTAAANLANDRDTISSLSSHAELGRWRMKSDEHKWYDAPFYCADLRFTPDSIAQLAAGSSVGITATVKSRNGGEAAGSVEIQSVSRGKLVLGKTSIDPGSPATLTATGASPDADKTTVASDLIAASTAGRAQAGWYARDELDLPKKISGVVATWSEIPGASKSYFHSWVVYTLANVYVSDSGYISAFYDLTTADQDEVENTIGPSAGCRYEAKASGGNIAAGDLELRKPPGGEWSHAIMYDVEVPDQVFTPTDCGPAPPPAFNGDVVGFLNMAMLGGSGFYPVENNFHFQQTAVSYTDPASGRKTTADWILDPGDPQ